MNEKLARLDEVLFKLYLANNHESENGKKTLYRKSKAMELDDETLKNFITKRLDKYSQAEDFLNDECIKNPIPEETKQEFLDLCIDLDISEDQASKLLERKLSTIPRELTREEKNRDEQLQSDQKQDDVLTKEIKTNLPKTGFSFTVSKANCINVYYFLYQNTVEAQWQFFTDELKALKSGSQITEEFMEKLAVSTVKPLLVVIDGIINDNKDFARYLSNEGDDYMGKFELFFHECLKVGRNAQQAWEQGQSELLIYNEIQRNSKTNSSSIFVGSLGFMTGYAAIKGISAATGKIKEKIREHKFASELDKRFLVKFQTGAIPHFERIYNDCISILWSDILFRFDTNDYFTFAKTYLNSGEACLKLLKITNDLIQFKDKIEFSINSFPWYLPFWKELIYRYQNGSEERQELLDYASSLTPLHQRFFTNDSDENKKILLSKKVPEVWQKAIETTDANVAVSILNKLLELQKKIKTEDFNDITQLIDELKSVASTAETREYLNTVILATYVKDDKDKLHKKMIEHLFDYNPLTDETFSSLENDELRRELQDAREYIDKYISKEDFLLYKDAISAAEQLVQLIPIINLEEKGQWISAFQELTKDVFSQFPKAILTWHITICSLMAGNDSLDIALNSYSSLTIDERSWLIDYEVKLLTNSIRDSSKQFFSFAHKLWSSEIGRKIEKQIPSNNKNKIIAQLTSAPAFLAKNQKEKIQLLISNINEPTFKYAESLCALYNYLSSESHEKDNLTRFLSDFPDIEQNDLEIILGICNKQQVSDVFANCQIIRNDLDDFDKKLLAGIMKNQTQPFSSRYEIFSKYIALRYAEVHENWEQAEKIIQSLPNVKKYESYFNIAKLYFELNIPSKGKTRLRSYVEEGTDLAELKKYWPHGKWEMFFEETYKDIITEHKTVVKNANIIELFEQLFNYSFSKKYSVCHADNNRISKIILPEINEILKTTNRMTLKPEDILVAFRSAQSDGIITPWEMISIYKSTKTIKHTYWKNAVKADRCWGATLRIELKNGKKDETSLEAFSYYPIDELVKICDFMISLWSDLNDNHIENILNSKFYSNPANWISLFSGERNKIHIFEIAEFKDGEIEKINRETFEITQKNLAKNDITTTKSTSASAEFQKKSEKNSNIIPQKLTKTAASVYFSNLNDPKIFVFPNIPREKLEAAVKGFDVRVEPSDIIVLVDNTLSGVADEGLIITLDAMYSKSSFDEAKEIHFDETKTLNINYKKRFLLGYAIEINGINFASLQLANAVPELLNCLKNFVTELRSQTFQNKILSTEIENTLPNTQNIDNDSVDSQTINSQQTSRDISKVTKELKQNKTVKEEQIVSTSQVKEEKNSINLKGKRKFWCSRCNKEYSEETKFCSECGNRIEEKDCNIEIEDKITFRCTQCAKEYPEGTKYCSECGGKIESHTEMVHKDAMRNHLISDQQNHMKKEGALVTPKATHEETDRQDNNYMELFTNINDDQIFVFPNIPTKKLNNAIESYAHGVKAEDVLVLVDDTLWGGAREGMIVTRNMLYSKALLETPVAFKLSPETEIRIINNEINVDKRKIHLTLPDKKSLPLLVTAILKMCRK